ncbi:MAG TPA: isocitrate lyase/phosphoenolpyruvate mutase family protein [Candidatus Limnocylindria bacterium]|jgi:2-methylisocitrate lyase-like PEP mutase family enzyme|nr:isocitrate lyase/phosphoenolpyruvate mutase family protein [Candidatus Limnocylindria bacterium]
MTQSAKAALFQSLHQSEGILLFPNPWDGGSARILESLGFRALATSSSACAATLGRRDGRITRDEAIAHCRLIVTATDLPVAADLENGFSSDPEQVAETIRLAAAAGLVGGSIEDYTGHRESPQYDLNHATERIAAAVAAVRSLPFPFTLTARAENFSQGTHDLDDTLRRLVAYERAGADVLFAPGLPDLAAVREVCSAVRKPVNFMVGIKGKSFTVAELAAVGVKRISFAASLYRAAISGFLAAAHEIKDTGRFNYLDTTVTTAEFNGLLRS